MRNKKHHISPAKLNSFNANINVAPLVDVVLVLLILFMVLTPLLEKDIAIQIPEDSFVEEIPEGQLVVSLDKAGLLYLNQTSIEDGDYVHKLRKVLAAKSSRSERVVFFSVDSQAGYEKVVFALDGARQAGALSLGLLTAPMDNASPPTSSSQAQEQP
jgi:biopolymer transport protein ExbD/biopolymer transport protein TolR